MNVPDELIPRLKQLWNAGLSAIECGEELGLVGPPDEIRDAVIRAHQAPTKAAVKVAKTTEANWTPERVAMLTKLALAGASAQEIANELGGTSRSAVLGKIERLKIFGEKDRRSGPTAPRRRSNLPARYSAGERDENLTFAVDGVDGAPAPEDYDIPVERRRSLLGPPHSSYPARGPRECGWPVGDPKEPGFFFCGGSAYDGGHYCAYHARVAGAGYHRRAA